MEGREGVGAWVEVMGGDDGALWTTLTLSAGRCWAGGAQDGSTPLYAACYKGHEEVVELLLADERVDVNQASKVRVGGKGEDGWRERAGRGGRVRCRVQCVSRRRAA